MSHQSPFVVAAFGTSSAGKAEECSVSGRSLPGGVGQDRPCQITRPHVKNPYTPAETPAGTSAYAAGPWRSVSDAKGMGMLGKPDLARLLQDSFSVREGLYVHE